MASTRKSPCLTSGRTFLTLRPIETHAFGFRLPPNAPEGQKRFPISRLGLGYVEQRGDQVLTNAAASALAKIASILSSDAWEALAAPIALTGPPHNAFPDNVVSLPRLREAFARKGVFTSRTRYIMVSNHTRSYKAASRPGKNSGVGIADES